MKKDLSLSGKKWKILAKKSEDDLINTILKLRNIKDQDSFFHPSLDLLENIENLSGSKKLIKRIHQSIENNERIMIYGDYDVDGITSSVIMLQALETLGAKVSARLPHRIHHGYGLRSDFFDECKKLDVKVVIAVDNGITNVEEIDHGNSLGIDTLIIDHHNCPKDLPPAYSIVNPRKPSCRYKEKKLTAAGLCFLVARELLKEKGNKKVLDNLLIFAALGTVADCTPLLDENRIIVTEGLKRMQKTKNKSLLLLSEIAGVDPKKITSEDIGFRIAPRINAAGRLDDPTLAFHLLRGEVKNAHLLHNLNKERQALTLKSYEEAEKIIEDKKEIPPVLFLYKSSWHPGVLGLIASRVMEKTGLPTFVAGKKDDGSIVGSARTPKEFNATASLRYSKGNLTHFGGHTEAAGFSLSEKEIKNFEKSLIKYAQENYSKEEADPILEIDTVLPQKTLEKDLWYIDESLEPFGIGNEKPLFLLENITIVKKDLIGKEKKHLKIIFKANEKNQTALAWNASDISKEINSDQTYDLAVKLRRNFFNGKTKYEFELIDIKIHN